MTKARKPLFSLEAKGKLGPLVISRSLSGSHKVAVKRPPANPRSPAQLLIRGYYGSGVETYHSLDETERLYYHNLYPRQRGHRAYLNFMKEWLMAKLPLHWLDHILGGRDEIASPLTEAAHPTTVHSLPFAHTRPLEAPPRNNHYLFSPFISHPGTSSATMTANRLYAFSFIAFRTLLLNAIVVRITTLAANKYIRLGIYSELLGIPGNLIIDAGQASVGTTGDKLLNINITLPPGFYYLACISDGTPVISAIEYQGYIPSIAQGSMSQPQGCGWYRTVAYGPLDPSWPADIATPIQDYLYRIAVRTTI